MSEEKTTCKEQNNPKKKSGVLNWFYRVLQGALIGIGGILPGVSGGVLCLMFGLYHQLMDFLSSPFKKLKKYFFLFLPVGIGGVIGLVGFAKLIEMLIDANQGLAYSIFVGMILGMMPALFREAGEKGRGRKEWTVFAVSLVVMTVLFIGLFIMKTNHISLSITPNPVWYLICGLVWGLSVIVPGLSSSSVLIVLGLYEPMMAEIGSLSLSAIIPIGTGILVVVLLLSKAVKRIFDSFYGIAYHFILGAVIATTVAIVPEYLFSPKGIFDVIIYAVSAVAGFFASVYLDKLGNVVKNAKLNN
ncbi:MAG: DUF368 domain-containing protein [Clostridia bacterium]|nr:DUF368 domain-containing protein [Clostridia bacterium]